jgi:hypothetical protein
MIEIALVMFWGAVGSGNWFFGFHALGRAKKELERRSIAWMSAL